MVVQVECEAEWHMAALVHFAGLPVDQAEATFLYYGEHDLGCEPDRVPAGKFLESFRLCRDCASRTGRALVVERGREGPVYAKPDDV
jgi:hypothetical protein